MNENVGRSTSVSGSDASVAELRRLLLGVEQRQIAHITERMDDPIIRAQEMANVLPDAVRVRLARDTRTADTQLADALRPTISSALEQAVTRDPTPFANALFPALGPAIRAAVSEMLTRALGSLDSALKNTFSPQGVRWRLEAWRTGRPLAEVVMLRTLVYRVEQVMLIDRRTGLPLLHLLSSAIQPKDAEERSAMMSGMLTAIRDYVQDAFGAPEGATLDAFSVGELAVCMEQGPRALVAAVVRGAPPPELRLRLREIVESLHQQFGVAFARFDGDAEPFELARPTLERALHLPESAMAVRRRSPTGAILVVALAVLAIAVLADIWWYRGYRFRQYVDRLRAEPGIVVTDASRSGLGFRVAGLRDPDATDPKTLRHGIAYDSARTVERWASYLSLDAALTLRRVERRLQAPPGVRLSVQGDTLTVNGSATSTWRDGARPLALATPGVRIWNDADLRVGVRARADSIAQSISNQPIRFGLSSSVLTDDELSHVQSMATDMRALLALAPLDGGVVSVAVGGFTDPTGTDSLNTRLAAERASVVRASLVSAGVPESALAGAAAENDATLRQRLTAVRVSIRWTAPVSPP